MCLYLLDKWIHVDVWAEELTRPVGSTHCCSQCSFERADNQSKSCEIGQRLGLWTDRFNGSECAFRARL